MDKENKKKINKLLSLGQSISKISKSLELNNDEVSAYVRKFFLEKYQEKNSKNLSATILRFPLEKLIQVKP
jgi:hypothetical protein